MSRFLLASLLPLAFLVGCGDPNGNGGNTECTDADCNDTDPTPGEFEATLRSVAPYGWVGDHRIFPVGETSNGPDCEDVNECGKLVDDFGNYRISLQGDTWDCVNQEILVGEPDEGETVNAVDQWTGEGICGLAPDGEYDGMDVDTSVEDYLNGTVQVTITIGSWAAVVTGTTFFYEDDEYLLEGTISDDLSSIDYHMYSYATDLEQTATINLEE